MPPPRQDARVKINFDISRNSRVTGHAAHLGFTLAEVLITLGIIGVVAALTIPTLIQNHKKQELVVRLKKAYSTINNGFRLSELDNGPQKDWPNNAALDLNVFWEVYVHPYFRGSRVCKDMLDCGYPTTNGNFRQQWSGAQWHVYTGKDELLFQLADGTVVFYPKNTYSATGEIWYTNQVLIDINGTKGPNKYCSDVFPFKRENGTLTPEDNNAISKCTKLIMENSWEIPDNYPFKI